MDQPDCFEKKKTIENFSNFIKLIRFYKKEPAIKHAFMNS